MRKCYALRPRAGAFRWKNQGSGRGGIRTHGGFPHARFRVECLKPGSATLPFGQKKTSNGQRRTSNIECNFLRDWAFDVGRWAFAFRQSRCCGTHRSACRANEYEPQSAPDETKKCYNFSLAKSAQITASCVSTRTATLLLVVDGYSQVLGAAVHQYSLFIQNLNPLLLP
jgi:hypothetical protein